MILIIMIIAIIIACILGYIVYIYIKKVIKLTSQLEKVNTELITHFNKPLLIGKITKYTKRDIDFLWKNKEFVLIMLKYIEFEIAKATDTMRNLNDWKSSAEKAGYLNGLHSVHLFLYKINNKKAEKEGESADSLV